MVKKIILISKKLKTIVLIKSKIKLAKNLRVVIKIKFFSVFKGLPTDTASKKFSLEEFNKTR